jgi:hypothetical protein
MGTDLAVYQITCPFCFEDGKFSTEFHAAKKEPNGRKVLNFDTLKCGNCAAYVQVFWSAGDSLHAFRVQPWPLKYRKAPDQYPEAIGRYWLQAKKNLTDEKLGRSCGNGEKRASVGPPCPWSGRR